MNPVIDTIATATTRALVEAIAAILERCSEDEAAAIERQLASLHSRAQRALGPRLDAIRDAALKELHETPPKGPDHP